MSTPSLSATLAATRVTLPATFGPGAAGAGSTEIPPLPGGASAGGAPAPRLAVPPPSVALCPPEVAVGGAGGATGAAAPSAIIASTSPTPTVSPSLCRIWDTTPDWSAVTSTLTLSV